MNNNNLEEMIENLLSEHSLNRQHIRSKIEMILLNIELNKELKEKTTTKTKRIKI